MIEETRSLLKTPRFEVVELTQLDQSGRTVRRQIARHPGAVVILPMVEENRVCLIRNYRVSVDQTLLELPAGTMETGEPPEITARRELIEETGYRAERIELAYKFFTSPGITDELMYLYVATGLTAGEAAREAGEDIENHVVDFDDALRMITDGSIADAKTIVGLMLFDQTRRATS